MNVFLVNVKLFESSVDSKNQVGFIKEYEEYTNDMRVFQVQLGVNFVYTKVILGSW